MEDVAARARWLAVALYGLMIFVASSIPSRALGRAHIWDYDKWIHAAVYAGLGFLVMRAWARLGPSVIVCALYGVTDEWHQLFTPGRDASAGDALADLVGALLGAALCAMLARRRPDHGDSA